MSDTLAAPPSYSVRKELKPKDLDGFSAELIDEHWKLYEGYVANTNALNEAIQNAFSEGLELNKPPIAEMQRRLGFEYNGMILHEYYFGALKKGTRKPPENSELGQKLALDFGSFDRWLKQFSEIGRTRGIGWVVTSLDPASGRLHNFWIGDHEIGHVAGFLPIIVMDMWEHSFVTDYGASAVGRGEYLKAYLLNLDWDVTAERLQRALQFSR